LTLLLLNPVTAFGADGDIVIEGAEATTVDAATVDVSSNVQTGADPADQGALRLSNGEIIAWEDATETTITHVDDNGLLLNLELEIDGTLDADGVVALGDGGDNFSVASDGIDIDTSGNVTNAGTIGSGAVTSTGAVGGTDLTASDDIIGQDDLQLDSDAALIQLGEDQDVTLTHVADTGVLVTGTTDEQVQIGDSGTYINQPVDGTLGITADTIADVTAPNIKLSVDTAAYLNVATADGGATTISQVSDGTDGIVIGDGGDTVSIASAGLDLDTSGNLTNVGTIGSGAITSTGDSSFDGAVTINDTGADKDTRIEASGAANALFVEGSSGNVGIGDGSPSATMTFADGSTIGTSTTATTVTLEADGDLFLASGNVFGAGISPGGRNNVSIDLENGIGFPATAVASSDVNVLDDYEEGTYNPTLVCGTSGSFGLAAHADTLAYTKIGQLVSIQGRILTAEPDTCAGQLRLSIPFDSAPGTEFSYLVSPSIVIRDHGDAELESPYLQGEGNQAYMAVTNVTDDGTVENVDHTRVDSAFYIQVSFSYITDVFG